VPPSVTFQKQTMLFSFNGVNSDLFSKEGLTGGEMRSIINTSTTLRNVTTP